MTLTVAPSCSISRLTSRILVGLFLILNTRRAESVSCAASSYRNFHPASSL